MARVLVVGDVHAPCTKAGYMEFCRDIYDAWDCDTVVFIGDLIDWHGISFHAREPGAPGVVDEYKMALACVQEWVLEFVDAEHIYVTIGSHDDRPARLAASVDIPAGFIRDYQEIWNTPGWDWVYDTIIDDVYYFHGLGFSGNSPAYNAAKAMGMSVVMGHIHHVGGIKWMVSPVKRWFGMDTGCGIDDRKWAFAYAKHIKKRSVISCGVVIDGIPYFEIMPLERYK